MKYICILLLIIVWLLIWLRDRNICNVASLFTAFWAIIMFFSSLGLYGIYESSDRAYIFITVGVLLFDLGATVGIHLKIKNNTNGSTLLWSINENVIDDKKFYILTIVFLLCDIPNIQRIFYVTIHGFNISTLYYGIATGDELLGSFGTEWQKIIEVYIGYPILYLLMCISIIKLLSTGNKKYIALSFLFVFARFTADIKRTVIIMAILLFVFFFIMIKRVNKKQFSNGVKRPKWLKTRYLMIVFIGFVVVYFAISFARRGDNEARFSLFKNLYFYYAGSIKYFDLRLDSFSTIIGEHTYGFYCLRGVLAPFFSTAKRLLNIEIPVYSSATDALYSMHNTVVWLSPNLRYNSYATVFFGFYIDGGIAGICIGAFLFGALGGRYYRNYLEYGTLYAILKLGYFISVYLFFSMLGFMPTTNYIAWAMIISPLVFSSRRKHLQDVDVQENVK